jgi:hypothetical protein
MKKDISKIRTIAWSIRRQTESDSEESIPRLFARAFASEILAETSEEHEAARESATAGAHDFERLEKLGVNTPLLHFGMATCLRIMKENRKAIESYKKYILMRPDDAQTKSIMEDLGKKLAAEQRSDLYETKVSKTITCEITPLLDQIRYLRSDDEYEILIKSAELGSHTSVFNLYKIIINGDRVPRDDHVAQQLLYFASSMGNEQAKEIFEGRHNRRQNGSGCNV